jgi:hypothetical protein
MGVWADGEQEEVFVSRLPRINIGVQARSPVSQYSRIFTESLTASQVSIVGSIQSKQKASASSFSSRLLDAITVLTFLYTDAISLRLRRYRVTADLDLDGIF